MERGETRGEIVRCWTCGERKSKPFAWYRAWWLSGVAKMKDEPWPDWKRDNPSHPDYQSESETKQVYTNTLEE